MARFGVLGTLQAHENGREIDLGSSRPRALLALLLLNANEVVSADRLIDSLWGERPPASSAKLVQGYVSRLRRAIAPEAIVTRGSGYLLRVDATDADRFAGLVARARDEAPETAAETLREALALWRGRPYADVEYEPWAQAEIARLEECRLVALEERIDVDLALGESLRLVPEVEALVARHPLRERLRAQLMTALYRSGRQAEALQVFADYRARLVDELAIEPGHELHELQRRILTHDPELGAARSSRRTEPTRRVFIGRDRELEDLCAGLDDARRAQGRLVLLAGEAGIGKTRLGDEVAEEARARGMNVLVGRCWEAGRAQAYWPWAQALRTYVRQSDPEALRSELGRGGGDVAQLLPELRELFPDLADVPAADPDAARFRFFDAVSSFLQRAAAERGLLLVLDDLHTADTPSLLLLQLVARESSMSRIFVLGTYRDDPNVTTEFAGALTELARVPSTTNMRLRGLAEADVGRYIEVATARTPAAEVVESVHAGTEGNPLFLVEVVRLLAAEGRLEAATGRLTVPRSLRDVIAKRLEPLSAECRRVLEAASAIGREFGIQVLARTTALDPGALLDVLDEAMAIQLVTDVPGNRTRLRFGHALFRDSIYDELSFTRRKQLHRTIGEAFVELSDGGDVHLAELAHQFCEAVPAVDAGIAVAYARRAGDQALSLLAPEEAHRLYETALSIVDDDERPQLLLRIARSLWMRGGRPEAQAIEARGVALAHGNRDAAAEAEVLLADIHWYEGNGELAAEDMQRALGLVGETQQTAATASVFEHAARFHMLAGENREAIRLGREGLALAETLGLDSIASHCLSSIGVARVCSGDGGGLADLHTAHDIAVRTHDGWAAWRAHTNLSDCLLWQVGDAARAFAERHALRPLLETAGSWAIALWNQSYDAWEAYWLGRWSEAARLCDEFIEHIEDGNAHNCASEMYSLRALIRVSRSDEAALDDARTAVTFARRAHDARSLYPALAYAADVAAELERFDETELLVDELLRADGPEPHPWHVVPLSFAALKRGRADDVLVRLARLQPSPWRDAAETVLRGDHEGAAERFATIGVLPEEAHARLLAAEAGRVVELSSCASFFERVGATRYSERCSAVANRSGTYDEATGGGSAPVSKATIASAVTGASKMPLR